MSEMTINDLRVLLVECAGEAESGELTSDTQDHGFDDFGYDSLALLEAAARITATYGVPIPEDSIATLRTPREVLDLVNGAIAHAGASG